MKKLISHSMIAAAMLAPLGFAEDVVTAVHGTITKVDSGTKTIVVKTADGTEHTVKVATKTAVHGTDAAAKDSFHGLKEGSEVVAHYTVKGTEKTAVEVDKVGKDGIKETEGTVTKIDHGAKTVAVKTADGTEQTFKWTAHATEDVRQGHREVGQSLGLLHRRSRQENRPLFRNSLARRHGSTRGKSNRWYTCVVEVDLDALSRPS